MTENQPDTAAPKSKGVSPITALVLLVFLGVVVFGGYFYYEKHGRLPIPQGQSGRQPEGGDTSTSSPLDVLRSEQVITDETIAVAAGGHQMRSFKLPSDRPVRVVAEGVQDTAKGFSVHCLAPSDWENLRSGQKFEYFTVLSAPKIQKFDHTARLPAGEYCVVVSNTENMFNTMQVRLRIIIDPKQ